MLQNPSTRSVVILGVVSVMNSLFNRIVMTKFFFDYPIVILMLQMAVTLFSIEMARLFNWVKLPAYTFHRGKDMFLPSTLYALSSYLVMNCLDGIAMPLFPPIQRFCPLAVVLLAFYTQKRSLPSRQVLLLVGLICFGGSLSSFYEISIDVWSIIYGIAAVSMHSLALVLIERLHENYSNVLDLIYMNSFNCLCLFLVADLVQDEIRDAFMYLITSMTMLFIFCFLALISLGVFFHIAIFYCVTQTNSLHASIIHNVAGALQIFVAYALSVYLFYDLAPSWTNIFGVFICISATAAFYSARHSFERFIDMKIPNGGSKYYMVGKS
ncbi:hypothetical protein FO519_002200 [Halicephalobus sp. NKZ332]|nr:hypothetical protein FO519_002200 [Halicephalobus sp. NKZ332]